MKAYPLFLLTLVGALFVPEKDPTAVYAEVAEPPSTITITPTGLDSCEVVSEVGVQASYSQTDAGEVGFVGKEDNVTYSLEGLDSVVITDVSFAVKSSNNTEFYIGYRLNGGVGVNKKVFFADLNDGKLSSSSYVDLTAPFDYPISGVDSFEFSVNVMVGYFNVQSLTITYEEAMDPFAKAMLSDLTCDESGSTPPSVEEWNAAKDAFETLSVEEQGKYKDAQADATGDTYQRVVAKYDYILSKYGTEEYANFLGRDVKETALATSYNDLSTIALLGLSLIAVAAFLFLVIARKRKQTKTY